MIDKTSEEFQARVRERLGTPAYASRVQEALRKGIDTNTSEHFMSVMHDAEDELELEDKGRSALSRDKWNGLE